MITREVVLQRVRGLDGGTLDIWISAAWVRPAVRDGAPVFAEIDVARLRLIQELRDELEVNDGAMPVVLSLLDQLHATRAQMLRLCAALEAAGDAPAAQVVRGLV